MKVIMLSFVRRFSIIEALIDNLNVWSLWANKDWLEPPLPLAIVTGAAQGIGFIISDRLLQEGYMVCLADINKDEGKKSVTKLQEKYGFDKAIFRMCDVTSEESFKETFSAVQQHGPVRLLINNAGIVDEYDSKRTVAVNLMGTITGCQLALQYMGTKTGGKGGTVINIGSIPSFLPYPNTPVYVATKHGIIGLTRSYGDESHFKETGILFTALCPLYVETPLLHSAKPLKVLEIPTAMKYLRPEEVADGISKLLKDRVNGSVLLVHEKMEYAEIPDQLKAIPFNR